MAKSINQRRRYPAENMRRAIVTVHAKVAIGASGAPTLTEGQGIDAVTRVSAGLYRVALSDFYSRLLGFSVQSVLATLSAVRGQVTTDSSTSTTAPLVEFTMFATAGGAATDPASGEILLVKFDLAFSPQKS